MKRFLIPFVCLLLTVVLGASPGQAAPKALVYSWTSNVGPLNPHTYSPNQMFAQAMVYEPLVLYDVDGKIKPCLAESWEISEDGPTCFTCARA